MTSGRLLLCLLPLSTFLLPGTAHARGSFTRIPTPPSAMERQAEEIEALRARVEELERRLEAREAADAERAAAEAEKETAPQAPEPEARRYEQACVYGKDGSVLHAPDGATCAPLETR